MLSLFINELVGMLFTQCTKRYRNCPQIFSEGALDFSEGALEESYEKVVDVALPLGLFPSKRWNVLLFRASDGNRNNTMGFPSLPRKRMSTNPPKLPNSPAEKFIALSENVPKSIGTSEKVFDGFLDEKGLFLGKSRADLRKNPSVPRKKSEESISPSFPDETSTGGQDSTVSVGLSLN